MKGIKNFLKKKKKKSSNMVVNVTKIFQKIKKINWLSKEENIIEWEKMPYYNCKKVFKFRKFCFFMRESIRNFPLFHLCLKSSLSINKKCVKKCKKFLIFRLFKFNFENIFFWGSDFENLLFKGAIVFYKNFSGRLLKMYFFRGAIFWGRVLKMYFFEGATF